MTVQEIAVKWIKVAPLTGCVDWNSNLIAPNAHAKQSHPSRGAWIEILR